MGKHGYLKTVLQAHEEEIVRVTLRECHWDKGKAAKILGISLSSLYRKIRLYSIRQVLS